MNTGFFNVLSNIPETGTRARAGVIRTEHSLVETPVFMPVGTAGTVKAILQKDLLELGFNLILGNSYHLFLRPGTDVIENAGGLHRFINWSKGLLTDSGGFQIFSLAGIRKINEDGVEFSSHLNGEKHFFTPEKVIDIQRSIGSDIMMSLDECLPYPVGKSDVKKSLALTHSWEQRCRMRFNETKEYYGKKQFLFSINQGSVFKDFRKESIDALNGLDFDGNAIGGLAVGEENEAMYEIVEYCTGLMATEKPRYLMGVGTPVDLLECIDRGVDMFDCVMPTRNARHGRIFTTYGEINIRNSRYRYDNNSPDPECKTYTSDNFSLSYLRHLFISNEILGAQLLTIHNLGFYAKLMRDVRSSIINGNFLEYKSSFLEKYNSNKKT